MTKEHGYQQQGSAPDLLTLDPTDFIPAIDLNLFHITSTFCLPGTISLLSLKRDLLWPVKCHQKECVSCPGRNSAHITASTPHSGSSGGNSYGSKPPPARQSKYDDCRPLTDPTGQAAWARNKYIFLFACFCFCLE